MGEISVFSRVADTLKKRSDHSLPHPPPKPGFTLAELLIALALLGIIAAFTIPKVLQASAEQETNAKLKETVATLENAWYSAKAKGELAYGGGFYNTVVPSLNVVASNVDFADQMGTGIYRSIAGTHPCTAGGAPPWASGWVQFANGVVITGVSTGDVDALPWNDPAHMPLQNGYLCLDVNGLAPPNSEGQDVFWGNFNAYGAFSGPPASEQASLKAFQWGNAGNTPESHVYADQNPATVFRSGNATPCVVVGCRLVQ